MSQKTSLMEKQASLIIIISYVANYSSPGFKKEINIFKLNDIKKKVLKN